MEAEALKDCTCRLILKPIKSQKLSRIAQEAPAQHYPQFKALQPQLVTPWEDHPSAEGFVLELEKKRVLNTWGLLYCGRRQVVVENKLRNISNKYDLVLNTEAFAFGGHKETPC
eukprot:scaffold4522_cov141-Skeletonema_menzelii.AAC.3